MENNKTELNYLSWLELKRPSFSEFTQSIFAGTVLWLFTVLTGLAGHNRIDALTSLAIILFGSVLAISGFSFRKWQHAVLLAIGCVLMALIRCVILLNL